MGSLVRILTHSGAGVSQSSKLVNLDKETPTPQTPVASPTIFFVTSNPGKLREVTKIFGEDFPVHIEPVSLDLEEIQDRDPDMIVIKKCGEAVRLLHDQAVMIEDTCLSFTALNQLPGPYVKWFEKAIGNEGLVRLLSAYEDKSASAVASISYWDGKDMFLFRGIVEGTIVQPRGPKESFGWDPIFMPACSDKTFAEMGPEAKNQISHRVKALQLFKDHISQARGSNRGSGS